MQAPSLNWSKILSLRVFTHKIFMESCEPEKLKILSTLFRKYKSGEYQPEEFGRDESYNRPPSVRDSGLMHIHVKDQTSKRWHLRHIRLFDKTSDTALVYCSGAIQTDCYLLLDLLENAHTYYRGSQFHLIRLAEIAEDFRNKY